MQRLANDACLQKVSVLAAALLLFPCAHADRHILQIHKSPICFVSTDGEVTISNKNGRFSFPPKMDSLSEVQF